MFHRCAALNKDIPTGLLANCAALQNISGMFLECTNLPTVPNSLFRKNTTDTNNLNNLTTARNVFGGCTKMKGVVMANFFTGAPKITDISHTETSHMPNSGSYASQHGFFGNTAITGYHEQLLYPLTQLKNCARLFYCSSANSTLAECYYYLNNEYAQRLGTISPNLFVMNSQLQNTDEMFRNRTGLIGDIPADLFSKCKTSLLSVANMFNGCTGLTGRNLDASEDVEDPNTGISPNWFSNARVLNNASGFLCGCSKFVGYIPEGFLSGCAALTNTSYMFSGCTELYNPIPRGLFDSCRSKIANVSYMFNGCKNLSGEMATGTYSVIHNAIIGYDLAKQDDEGALRVVSVMNDPSTEIDYATVVGTSEGLASQITDSGSYYVKPQYGDKVTIVEPGLLSECLALTTTKAMFKECNKLGVGGPIPHDIFFTSSVLKKYEKLTDASEMFMKTGFDKPYEDTSAAQTMYYLVSSGFLEKCTGLTNISHMFRGLLNMPACQLYMNMFDRQTKLTNASYLFYSTRNLTGQITQNLLRNSLGSLLYINHAFTHCNMTSVVNGFLSAGTTNKVLKRVGSIFHSNTNLKGNK